MLIETRQINSDLLRETCGYGAYERGRGYARQGRAKVMETHPLETGGLRLLCSNRGSHGRFYDQQIDIEPSAAGLRIMGVCECPMRYNCKHVVAACLTWKAQALAQPNDDSFDQWLERFRSIGPERREEPVDVLLYLLVPRVREKDIEVKFIVTRRKADGNWGKGRQTKLASFSAPYASPRYLQPVDKEIAALLVACNPYAWGATTLGGAAGHTALELMLDSGRAFWSEQRLGPLRRGEERAVTLEWKQTERGYGLSVELDGAAGMIPVTPPWYVDPERLCVGALRLPKDLDARQLAMLREVPLISERAASGISRRLALQCPELPTPIPVSITDLREPPTPRLTLHPDAKHPGASRLALDFLYAGQIIDPTDPALVLTREQDKGLVRIHRDPSAEAAADETLRASGVEPLSQNPGHYGLVAGARDRQRALADWFRFTETVVPDLEGRGWEVVQASESGLTLHRADSVDAEVQTAGMDWFGLHFDLDVDGEKVPLLPLVSELLADYRPGELPETLYLDAGDGRYIAVAAKRIEPVLQVIVDLFDREGGDAENLRLSRLDAPRLLDLGEVRIHGGHELQRLAHRLRNFDGIKPTRLPTTFQGELRSYQQRGLDWLQFLRSYQLGGVLADDMGLGKTVQTLAHLAVEKRAGRMRHPSLIVAPTSLVGNWRREAGRFTPRLKVLVLHGPERRDFFDALPNYDLVLTTYPLLPRDAEVLGKQPWHYLILDEAQQVKNPKSQAARQVRRLQSNHRLCLTGTPMENHLGELWTQFDFLLPGFLGDQSSFARNYRTPIEKQGDGEKLKLLTQRIAPFLLRRTKAHVAKELPEKTELLRTIPLEGKQAALYESIRLTMEKRVRDAVARKGLARSHITVLDALLKLRQVCCDPRLLPPGTGNAERAGSAKLKMLMELLPEMIEEGRRILLFSQFTTMLGLIEQALKPLGIPYAKLTGQTRKREQAIETFRSGGADLFLISLKAGGVGLNLPEADTVIHYDPWWNPAVEAQATDRAHRIGQKRSVFVYKLITEATVEEKILSLQARKHRLADNIYGAGRGGHDLPIDTETIHALLAESTTRK